ncbi:MAG: clostripain-related cysteine peptidase [Candidatus Methylomirabilia bacterium]
MLAYLAGDNDLKGSALEDINEMERVGSRPGAVESLVQADRAAGYDASEGDWRSTRRYYITQGADPRSITSTLLADLGETNTGDPTVLEEFLGFGVKYLPAQAYALILWNHGSGFYVPPEMLSRDGAPSRRELWARATPRLRRSFFSTTRECLLHLDPQRQGIGYDDGSLDCLDNRELKRVLASAHRLLGRKVDPVGMDAYLMTMLEVAYQIRDHALVLVGSEELEPFPPFRDPSAFYRELDFARRTRWADFLGAYLAGA